MAATTLCDIGDLVRISGSFVDALTGSAADPTVLKIAIKDPSGAETVYTYDTDAEVVRDEEGEFHFDLLITSAGDDPWYYRWRATGAVTAADEGFVKVRQSHFVDPLI